MNPINKCVHFIILLSVRHLFHLNLQFYPMLLSYGILCGAVISQWTITFWLISPFIYVYWVWQGTSMGLRYTKLKFATVFLSYFVLNVSTYWSLVSLIRWTNLFKWPTNFFYFHSPYQKKKMSKVKRSKTKNSTKYGKLTASRAWKLVICNRNKIAHIRSVQIKLPMLWNENRPKNKNKETYLWIYGRI